MVITINLKYIYRTLSYYITHLLYCALTCYHLLIILRTHLLSDCSVINEFFKLNATKIQADILLNIEGLRTTTTLNTDYYMLRAWYGFYLRVNTMSRTSKSSN